MGAKQKLRPSPFQAGPTVSSGVLLVLAILVTLPGCEKSREQKLLECLQEADDRWIAEACRRSFDDNYIATLRKEKPDPVAEALATLEDVE